jgi:hypothetical protein
MIVVSQSLWYLKLGPKCVAAQRSELTQGRKAAPCRRLVNDDVFVGDLGAKMF